MAKAAQLQILSGWKEIANYLRLGVRTVQRYERELRLPVHRPAAKFPGAVIATKAELDAWVSASPIREAFRLPQSAVNCHTRVVELHGNVGELRRLREETKSLRAELHTSLASLHATVAALAEKQGVPPSSSSQRRFLAGVLPFNPERKKAN